MVHILSHYGGKTEDRLRHYMACWILNHLTWVRSISRSLLQKKGLDIKDYLTYIITKGTPFDEISLLIFCRMYKVHLAVISKLDFWTTRREKDIRYCDIALAYRGNLQFDDTAKLEIVNPLMKSLSAKVTPIFIANHKLKFSVMFCALTDRSTKSPYMWLSQITWRWTWWILLHRHNLKWLSWGSWWKW